MKRGVRGFIRDLVDLCARYSGECCIFRLKEVTKQNVTTKARLTSGSSAIIALATAAMAGVIYYWPAALSIDRMKS